MREDINTYESQEHNWKKRLEAVKRQAEIDVEDKERQLSEHKQYHNQKVIDLKLNYEESLKSTSEAYSREQNALDTIKTLSGKIRTLEQRISGMTDEHIQKIKTLEVTVSDYERDLKELTATLQNTQSSERQLKERLKQHDEDWDQLNALKKKQESERRGFGEKMAEKDLQLQQANKKLQHFNSEIQNLQQELNHTKSKLNKSIDDHKASVQAQIKAPKDDSLFHQLEQMKSKEKELASENHQLRQKLKDNNNELEETKTRLSKLMGQRLTDNNPNITDLSDKNRPTKLAERYSELYDNEWTDAFEDLDKIYSDEKKTIASLTFILTEAATFCRSEADGQMEKLRKCLILETTLSASRGQAVPDVINKQLKDSRKTMAEEAGKHLVESYIKRLKQLTSSSARDALRVETFLREAVPLCWLMSIQDPPVVFDRLLQHGEKFNTELYRSYTKAGPVVDFPVWPTMFLHEGGPVLYKGLHRGVTNNNSLT